MNFAHLLGAIFASVQPDHVTGVFAPVTARCLGTVLSQFVREVLAALAHANSLGVQHLVGKPRRGKERSLLARSVGVWVFWSGSTFQPPEGFSLRLADGFLYFAMVYMALRGELTAFYRSGPVRTRCVFLPSGNPKKDGQTCFWGNIVDSSTHL